MDPGKLLQDNAACSTEPQSRSTSPPYRADLLPGFRIAGQILVICVFEWVPSNFCPDAAGLFWAESIAQASKP